jgi:hypothetical protein
LAGKPPSWTHRRFFDLLTGLGRLRVISISGPSVFEALCDLPAYQIAGGHLNAITPAYHWHLGLAAFRYLRSRDEVHARSGRRVLFFELREREGEAPFLRIYVHREKDREFEPAREKRFLEAHADLAEGIQLADGSEA